MTMEIIIKSTNIKLTDSINGYINKRLGYLDKLISDEDTSVLCNVEVGKTSEHHQSGDIFRSEINLHIAGQDFRAVSEARTLFTAIDETKDQMQKELRRYKRKRIRLIRRGGAKIKELLRNLR